MRGIIAAANQANVAVAPHSAYFGPGLIATAHLCAALCRAPMIERLYCDLTESPFGDWYEPVDGFLSLPQGPGLGIEPDQDLLKKLRVDGRPRRIVEGTMKIQQVETNLVRLPVEEPLVGAPPYPAMMREFLTVRVRTDDGIEGIGITAFGGKLMRALHAAVMEFGELAKGEDSLRTEHVTAKLRAASAPCGPGGIAALALSAIDIALWDIRGKALGAPLARLLGGLRDRVPAYASGALMRTTPLDKIERAAAALV